MNDQKIKNIIDELGNYKHTKSDLIKFYTQQRLNQNLTQYYKKLQQSVEFLQQRDNKKILKRLNRVDNDDK